MGIPMLMYIWRPPVDDKEVRDRKRREGSVRQACRCTVTLSPTNVRGPVHEYPYPSFTLASSSCCQSGPKPRG